MEEKYKKFMEYNWEDSQEWHSYFENIYPTPPKKKILRYKKKFFRNKIDPDFDIDYKPQNSKEEEEEQEQKQENTINSNNNTNSDSNFKNSSSSNSYQKNTSYNYSHTPILNIETMLLILFIFSLPLNYNSKIIAIITFLIKSIRLVGIPKFEKTYLHQLLKNESFHTFIFAIELLTDNFNYFLMVPIIISAIISICDNIRIYNLNLGKIGQIIEVINNKKEDLLQDKSDIELALSFFLVIGYILKINSILIFIIHIQILFIKYNFDFRLQKSFNILNTYINQFKDSNNCPSIFKNIIQHLQNMLESLVKRN